VKGELLLVELPEATDVVWREAAVYARNSRTAWIAGTEERSGFNDAPSDAGRRAILSGAAAIWPGVEKAQVLRHVAGLRPVSADGIPLAGPAPGWDNVTLALGGGRKGMLLSAAIGRAVAELSLTGATRLPIEPCATDRFAGQLVANPHRREPQGALSR
jgi:glycine/D-amino acid oxidase-like deaminating enzyme